MRFIVTVDAAGLQSIDDVPIDPERMRYFIEEALDNAGLESYATVEIEDNP